MATPTKFPAPGRISLIVGNDEMTFSEMTGISVEVQLAAQSGPGGKIEPPRLAGRLQPPTISLRRAAGRERTLWDWHASVRAGNMGSALRDAELVIFSPDGEPVVTYSLVNAWPAKIELSGLKAGAAEMLIESVTLACESISPVAP